MFDIYFTYFCSNTVYHTKLTLHQLIDFFNDSFNKNVFSHFYVDFNGSKEGEYDCINIENLKHLH